MDNKIKDFKGYSEITEEDFSNKIRERKEGIDLSSEKVFIIVDTIFKRLKKELKLNVNIDSVSKAIELILDKSSNYGEFNNWINKLIERYAIKNKLVSVNNKDVDVLALCEVFICEIINSRGITSEVNEETCVPDIEEVPCNYFSIDYCTIKAVERVLDERNGIPNIGIDKEELISTLISINKKLGNEVGSIYESEIILALKTMVVGSVDTDCITNNIIIKLSVALVMMYEYHLSNLNNVRSIVPADSNKEECVKGFNMKSKDVESMASNILNELDDVTEEQVSYFAVEDLTISAIDRVSKEINETYITGLDMTTLAYELKIINRRLHTNTMSAYESEMHDLILNLLLNAADVKYPSNIAHRIYTLSTGLLTTYRSHLYLHKNASRFNISYFKDDHLTSYILAKIFKESGFMKHDLLDISYISSCLQDNDTRIGDVDRDNVIARVLKLFVKLCKDGVLPIKEGLNINSTCTTLVVDLFYKIDHLDETESECIRESLYTRSNYVKHSSVLKRRKKVMLFENTANNKYALLNMLDRYKGKIELLVDIDEVSVDLSELGELIGCTAVDLYNCSLMCFLERLVSMGYMKINTEDSDIIRNITINIFNKLNELLI